MESVLRSVSVNSSWVHLPGQPREIFFERANPGHPGNFLSNSLPLGQKMMVEFPAPGAKNDGQIPVGGAQFSQTKETAP